MAKQPKAQKAKKEKLSNAAPVGNGFVYCAIPQGLKLKVPGGEVFIQGVNTAKLVQTEGGAMLPGGKFGINTISESDWAFIQKSYGELSFFKAGLIFSAETRDSGNDEAQDKQDVPTGAEQIDVDSGVTPQGDALETKPADNKE